MRLFILRSILFILLSIPGQAKAQVSDSQVISNQAIFNDSITDLADSAIIKADSSLVLDSVDTILAKSKKPALADTAILTGLLLKNRFLNVGGEPVHYEQKIRPAPALNVMFYYLFILLLIFGILKSVYAKYFNTMWRVFFNTSMRQSQLSEQLRQAGQPSMFFNLLFVLVSAIYVYLLMNYFNGTHKIAAINLIGFVCLAILGIYIGKFFILKFIGWVTGFTPETNNYIFIVFLINKIFSICMLPVVVVIAFAPPQISNMAIQLSFVLIGFMLLMRFIRSYGVFQGRFRISSFHFLLYIAGMEVIPLLLLYKVAILFISKKL